MADDQVKQALKLKAKALETSITHIHRCDNNVFQRMASVWKKLAQKENMLFGRVQRLYLKGGHVIHIFVTACSIVAFVGSTVYYTLI